MRVGIRLDGAEGRRLAISLTRLHGQEWPTRLGAGHLDPLISFVGAVCGRDSLLGIVAIVEQLLVRSDWLPAAALTLLPLLLLLPPDIVQQYFTVASPPNPSPPSPHSTTFGKSVGRPCPPIGQRF